MLNRKFEQAVSWCLSPEKMTATWQRVFERAFGDGGQKAVADAHDREKLVHNQAKRAVEWNWGRSPTEMRDFIRQETPPGGYSWGVTADEIFTYSQEHYLELLPTRVDSASQPELDALRTRLQGQPESPTPQPV